LWQCSCTPLPASAQGPHSRSRKSLAVLYERETLVQLVSAGKATPSSQILPEEELWAQHPTAGLTHVCLRSVGPTALDCTIQTSHEFPYEAHHVYHTAAPADAFPSMLLKQQELLSNFSYLCPSCDIEGSRARTKTLLRFSLVRFGTCKASEALTHTGINCLQRIGSANRKEARQRLHTAQFTLLQVSKLTSGLRFALFSLSRRQVAPRGTTLKTLAHPPWPTLQIRQQLDHPHSSVVT
jgi:hypothetical protein